MRETLKKLGSSFVWALVFFFFLKTISFGYDYTVYAVTGKEPVACENIADLLLPRF